MQVNIDTRNIKFQKDDLVLFDGKKFVKISKKELLAEVFKELKEVKEELKTVRREYVLTKEKNDKLKNFFKMIGGKKK